MCDAWQTLSQESPCWPRSRPAAISGTTLIVARERTGPPWTPRPPSWTQVASRHSLVDGSASRGRAHHWRDGPGARAVFVTRQRHSASVGVVSLAGGTVQCTVSPLTHRSSFGGRERPLWSGQDGSALWEGGYDLPPPRRGPVLQIHTGLSGAVARIYRLCRQVFNWVARTSHPPSLRPASQQGAYVSRRTEPRRRTGTEQQPR